MILFTVSAAFFLYLYVSQRMGDVPDPAQFEGLTNFQDGKFRNLDPVVLDRKKIARKSNWLRKLTSREHFPPASLPILSATPEELAKPDMDFSVRWLGHASLLMEWGSLRILVDPVFGNAAPVPGIVPRYTPPPIRREDLPHIDWVLLTHDHYDHLEYDTIRFFVCKTKTRFVVPLGVGTRLRGWGIAPERIVELNWYDSTVLYDTLTVTMTPGRHF
ncbi:MAG: MBL fold metallo-hydrolase, partial [Lentisphaeria bacterium]|nr:MBL fold metallo-hydrolase [Lentisphaeria bacterium]